VSSLGDWVARRRADSGSAEPPVAEPSESEVTFEALDVLRELRAERHDTRYFPGMRRLEELARERLQRRPGR
jgi:hypothetical protein